MMKKVSRTFPAAFVLSLLLLFGCNASSKEEMLQEGRALAGEKNINGAIILFKNALEKDQNFYEARYELGKAYLETGKYEKAEKELSKVALQDPTNDSIHLDLARIYLTLEKPAKAKSSLETFHSTQPETSESLLLLARAHRAEDDLKKASENYQKSIRLDEKNADPRVELAVLYLSLGRINEGEEVLKETVAALPEEKRAYHLQARLEEERKNFDKAIDLYNEVLLIDSDDKVALYHKALIWFESEKIAETEEIADRFLKKFPQRPEGYQLKGMTQLKRKEYENAQKNLEKSLSIARSTRTSYFLGVAHSQQGSHEIALNQYNEALDLDPNFAAARIALAFTLLKQNRFDEAAYTARQAIQQAPSSAIAHNVLGSALLALGQRDAAAEALSKALQLDPGLSAAHLQKGLLDLSEGKIGEAEGSLVKAVEGSPENPSNRVLLSNYYVGTKRFDKAVEVLSQGLSGGREDAFFLNQIAQIQVKKGDVEEGLNTLEKATASDPEFLPAYFNLGAYQVASGNFQAAADVYGKILKIDPSNTRAAMIRARVLETSGEEEAKTLRAYEKLTEIGGPAGAIVHAGYLARQGDTAQALTVLETAEKASPDHEDLLETKGRLLIESERFVEGAAMFDKLASVNPERGYSGLVAVHFMSGETAKAVQLGRDLIERKPSEPLGYLLMSSVQTFLKQPEQAIATLDAGLSRIGQSLPLSMRKAELLTGAGKLDEALALYRNIERSHPDYHPALYAQGLLYHQQQKPETAASFYRKTLEKSADFAPALNNLAYLLLEGDPQSIDEGLNLAYRAFRLKPADPAVMDTLGYALYKKGDYASARKVLEAAVKGLPEHPTVNYHLALAYLELDEKEKAVGQLQLANAKAAFPEKNDVQKLLNELQ